MQHIISLTGGDESLEEVAKDLIDKVPEFGPHLIKENGLMKNQIQERRNFYSLNEEEKKDS